ncbi:MAG TPA: hypothetical protein VN873_07925 [Candidatus Angelobacter sp.]|nr:hypothetical protein [Candidatus Angelobacter sp.]
MNPETENFDSLRQLLALKRHEVPPPGYFNRFPRDVMARIKAGETGGVMGDETSWWRRLLSIFDVKPVFAGAFGTAVCAFVFLGFISTEQTPASAAAGVQNRALSGIPVSVSGPAVAEEVSATSSNSIASGSLFDQFSLQPTPVSERYSFPAGGN